MFMSRRLSAVGIAPRQTCLAMSYQNFDVNLALAMEISTEFKRFDSDSHGLAYERSFQRAARRQCLRAVGNVPRLCSSSAARVSRPATWHAALHMYTLALVLDVF